MNMAEGTPRQRLRATFGEPKTTQCCPIHFFTGRCAVAFGELLDQMFAVLLNNGVSEISIAIAVVMLLLSLSCSSLASLGAALYSGDR
jgi:hypothetical protein